MTDSLVLAGCRAGDTGSLVELVRELSPVAWRIAFRMLADNEAAEDVAQEAMVKVWKKIGRLDNDGSFGPWFYRIVVNCCYDELRRKKREMAKPADELTWHRLGEIIRGDDGSEPTADEYGEIMRTVTAELSPKQRAVFVLSDLEGMNNERISEITGLNANSLKSNLYHARKKVKEIIRGRY